VAALSGALGAGLACMVANLTVGKKGYEAVWEEMKEVAAEGQGIKDHFVGAVDRDTEAFNAVMAGFRMPKGTPEQKAARDAAILEATKTATLVPFEVLKAVPRALDLALVVASKGNKNSASDAGVAASALRTAAEGAWLNVRINLATMDDGEFKKQLLAEGQAILRTAHERADAVGQVVDQVIGV
jgi:glutamate formiminotransferase/formiminotetrahydrofolate cyclodeaminase